MCAFMSSDGKIEIVKWTESVGWIMELSGSRTWVPVVVDWGFFKIIISFTWMSYPFAPVSPSRLNILMKLFSTACLYEIHSGGTEVLYV